MPTLSCPDCGTTLRLPEAAAGKVGRCPRCQARITFTAAPSLDDAPVEVAEDESAARRKEPHEADQQRVAKPKAKGKGKNTGKRKKKPSADRTRVRLMAGGAIGLVVLL